MKNKIIHKYFSEEQLSEISNKIKEIEKTTSGEVVVSIKENVSVFELKKSIRELAEKEFVKCGMSNTKDKTGILFLLLLSKQLFYILADTGINEKVEKNTWDKIAEKMQTFFRAGNFYEGIIQGLTDAENILSEHFPLKLNDTNELSNEVRLN